MGIKITQTEIESRTLRTFTTNDISAEADALLFEAVAKWIRSEPDATIVDLAVHTQLNGPENLTTTINVYWEY